MGGTRATQGSIHFKEEIISLCHPERSEGSLAGHRSFPALRMTLLPRLRLTHRTSSLKCIGPKGLHPPHPPRPPLRVWRAIKRKVRYLLQQLELVIMKSIESLN